MLLTPMAATLGFGTCAPPAKASEAIDEVLENVLPLFNHLGYAAFDPAEPPRSNTPLRNENRADRAAIKMPSVRDVVSFGVRGEAEADELHWEANMECVLGQGFPCYSEDCGAQGDVCSGPWWSLVVSLHTRGVCVYSPPSTSALLGLCRQATGSPGITAARTAGEAS